MFPGSFPISGFPLSSAPSVLYGGGDCQGDSNLDGETYRIVFAPVFKVVTVQSFPLLTGSVAWQIPEELADTL